MPSGVCHTGSSGEAPLRSLLARSRHWSRSARSFWSAMTIPPLRAVGSRAVRDPSKLPRAAEAKSFPHQDLAAVELFDAHLARGGGVETQLAERALVQIRFDDLQLVGFLGKDVDRTNFNQFLDYGGVLRGGGVYVDLNEKCHVCLRLRRLCQAFLDQGRNVLDALRD